MSNLNQLANSAQRKAEQAERTAARHQERVDLWERHVENRRPGSAARRRAERNLRHNRKLHRRALERARHQRRREADFRRRQLAQRPAPPRPPRRRWVPQDPFGKAAAYGLITAGVVTGIAIGGPDGFNPFTDDVIVAEEVADQGAAGEKQAADRTEQDSPNTVSEDRDTEPADDEIAEDETGPAIEETTDEDDDTETSTDDDDFQQPAEDAVEETDDTPQPAESADEDPDDVQQPSEDTVEDSDETQQPVEETAEDPGHIQQPAEDADEETDETQQPSEDTSEETTDENAAVGHESADETVIPSPIEDPYDEEYEIALHDCFSLLDSYPELLLAEPTVAEWCIDDPMGALPILAGAAADIDAAMLAEYSAALDECLHYMQLYPEIETTYPGTVDWCHDEPHAAIPVILQAIAEIDAAMLAEIDAAAAAQQAAEVEMEQYAIAVDTCYAALEEYPILAESDPTLPERCHADAHNALAEIDQLLSIGH